VPVFGFISTAGARLFFEEVKIMQEIVLKAPLREEDTRVLNVGDVVYIDGAIYTARDMAHLTVRKLLEAGGTLPVDFVGSVLFHAGPVVKKTESGWDMVVIGPTTSIRMEPYAEMVGKLGVKVIIGKGGMLEGTSQVNRQYGSVYLQAAPGCAAKLAAGIERIDGVHWLELGVPEAMWILKARKFGPLVVSMDSKGHSIYRNLREKASIRIKELYG
jgi:tartrate/fumarate subfamily iron-sulfur-dependent hydro-lyase beta chain